jgi:hypothetical protein
MTVQFSVAVRNAKLDAIETAIGAAAVVKIRTGAPPANCAAADTGSVLWTEALASDWAAAAAGGVKAWNNLPIVGTVDADGTPGHYRIYASDGVTCHEQGTVTITGGGGDMTVDSTTWTTGQEFRITGKSQTEGNG